MARQPLLTVTGLRYSADAPHPISLALDVGDRVGLLGNDEAHLSAFLQVLAGLRAPLAGRLMWRGKRLRRVNQLRRHVRLVWRNPYVLFGGQLSARDLLFSRRGGPTDEELRAGGMPSAVADFDLQALSGVQRIRVTLVHLQQRPPDILLIDDIFQSIIPEAWDEILQTLSTTTSASTALVIASGRAAALRAMRTVYRMTETGLMPVPREAMPGGTLPSPGAMC